MSRLAGRTSCPSCPESTPLSLLSPSPPTPCLVLVKGRGQAASSSSETPEVYMLREPDGCPTRFLLGLDHGGKFKPFEGAQPRPYDATTELRVLLLLL